MAEEVAGDTQHSALIRDHGYNPPEGNPSGLCVKCHMGQASHLHPDSKNYKPDPSLQYRCPDCVTKGVDPCPHQR